MNTATRRRKARNPKRRHPGTVSAVRLAMIPQEHKPSIVLVSNGDDWEGLYVDGQLMRQNHRIEADDVLSAVGIELDKRWVSSEYLGDTVSQLPDKLSDIPPAAFHD